MFLRFLRVCVCFFEGFLKVFEGLLKAFEEGRAQSIQWATV